MTPTTSPLPCDRLALLRWHRLTPVRPLDALSSALRELLQTDQFQHALREEEAACVYPARSMHALRAAGLAALLGERADGPALFTSHHVFGLNASLASHSGSLGISVGVNMLGLLPIYLGATPAQREALLAPVREGGAVALLLTEWDHGSDLKANQTRAEAGRLEAGAFVSGNAGATHYRVSGQKHLINAAAHSELLVTLVRTRTEDGADAGAGVLGAAADMSVLVIAPGVGVNPLPRHATLVMQAADIGGMHFDAAIVPATRRLGEEGEGFNLIQRTLSISRGGIGALAAGTSSRALAVAQEYAATRELYGAPLAALDPINEHLLRADALDLAIACLSVKAACVVNVLGTSAAHLTAIAKYACCELAEQVVDEGRRVLSARALVGGDYERLIRDVLLYAVFDGTRHVMLQQIQARLRQLVARPSAPDDDASLALLRRAYQAEPARLADVCRRREPAQLTCPAAHARALSRVPGELELTALVALADALREVATVLIERTTWQSDQASAFACARVLSWLETAFAVAELGDPGRRRALGLPDYDEAGAVQRARYALGLLGGRAASELSALAAAQRIARPDALLRAETELWALTGSARSALRQKRAR
jgi:alkylation response protein AidB-like acyl-CoA dehydrogenase